ncbi:MAG TPA: response regulator transcription factor, partial [Solirubrobacteraceae bacterium]|nr:response regulator transcription factor [Solirubrobacteraceae bacterium]
MADLYAESVLVVHPDAVVRERVVAVLAARGHRVSAAARADRPLLEPAVLVVDHRSVPWSSAALIMALVPGHDEAAILDAFAAGADDVLAGPLRAAELASRVAGLLRRPAASPCLRVGPLAIDPLARRASLAGRPLELTRREFELIHLLSSVAGQVLQREDIYQRVWGYAMAHGDRSVDV